MKTVSVFMDVEDPINPLADDAASDFAGLFTEAGVRGSFCITGEKCRSLLARGRADIVDSFRGHCLGLHTDTHSQHPTTMELLETLPFEAGCLAALGAETKGFEAFLTAFGRSPSFWGGAGNTWSPEITSALQELGIPAYAYALTQLPDHGVHKFNGVIALPQALSVSEDDWADDDRAARAADTILRRLKEIDQPWIGIFVGHPTRFRYKEFWDKPYAYGRMPAEPEFVEPLPQEAYNRGRANLGAFLRQLKRAAKIVGVDEAVALPWSFRPPSDAEIAYFKENTSRTIRGAAAWPIHRPDLNTNYIAEKTMSLADTVTVGEIVQG
jgi:hypothetical protein